MIVVADTSVLLNLCRVGEADLLWRLYGVVMAPVSVQKESERAVQVYERFRGLAFPGFIRVLEPRQSLETLHPGAKLDQGESDAIALTLELSADLLLMDERKGRRLAKQLRIRFSGILGALVEAKQHGFVPQLRPLLSRLRDEAGFFLGERQMGEVLRLVAEL